VKRGNETSEEKRRRAVVGDDFLVVVAKGQSAVVAAGDVEQVGAVRTDSIGRDFDFGFAFRAFCAAARYVAFSAFCGLQPSSERFLAPHNLGAYG
jgi:hypothetical protein